MTTIKEHIDAGRYPTDDKGRPLVPHIDGSNIVVAATDKPGHFPIVGWRANTGVPYVDAWPADGAGQLLPPPKRKAAARGYVIAYDDGGASANFWKTATNAQTYLDRVSSRPGVVVPVSGEIEVDY